jgi:hypothetical protein
LEEAGGGGECVVYVPDPYFVSFIFFMYYICTHKFFVTFVTLVAL